MTKAREKIRKEFSDVVRRTKKNRGRMEKEMQSIEKLKEIGISVVAPYKLRMPFERDVPSLNLWACSENKD